MVSTQIVRTCAEREKFFSGQLQEMEDTLVFFDRHLAEHRSFIVALDAGQVVGMVSLKEESMRVPGAMAITFVSVRADRRKQGIGRQLVKALFDFAEAEGRTLANTQYEDDGRRFLKPLLEAAARENPQVAFSEHPSTLH